MIKEGLPWLDNLGKNFGNIELVSNVVIKSLLYSGNSIYKVYEMDPCPISLKSSKEASMAGESKQRTLIAKLT